MSALQMTCGFPPGTSGTPVLETERLFLRAPKLDDAEVIARLANNRKIAEMTALIPHPYGVDDARAWIESLSEDGQGWTFAITAKAEGGALIGACGYGRRHDDFADEPEIGYWIGENFWGRGYATEAVRAVIDHLFSVSDLDALAAGCRVTNLASRRVIEKCGFQWTGAALFRVRALGASVPADRFRLERRIWASLRAWGKSGMPKIAAEKKKGGR
jgi:RimJ/RimL family protein N-acetyltransferase